MFVFGPSLLLIGTPERVALSVVTSILGVICLAGGLSGYLAGRATPWQRVVLVAAALVLIKPGIYTDLIGIALMLGVVAAQMLGGRLARTGKAV
jgi:TRAP-type uncharacterized transport system fused permease subunit